MVQPKISVVIPVYNTEKYLKRCVVVHKQNAGLGFARNSGIEPQPDPVHMQ